MLLFDAVGMVLMNALMGAGDMKRVMVVATAFQWLFFLPADLPSRAILRIRHDVAQWPMATDLFGLD